MGLERSLSVSTTDGNPDQEGQGQGQSDDADVDMDISGSGGTVFDTSFYRTEDNGIQGGDGKIEDAQQEEEQQQQSQQHEQLHIDGSSGPQSVRTTDDQLAPELAAVAAVAAAAVVDGRAEQ
ncbi:unnamed protein product [Ambrosiozyma monospora]|uniref:Unnamed protein product n=1 Tax=Ambrosiozyma monospora TaxID=43982 RepID=A0ACB5U2J2_AMBMO|nr:unnamed protein product [Ambrosiozyma monospora]